MQNAESYVALGQDNSGAAAIPRGNNPMAGAFAVYDAGLAADKKRKTALLDSFGNDLSSIGGTAWEVDFPEINQEKDKFLMMKADYMARNVDLTKDVKAYRELAQQKQKVVDLAAKSKYDHQAYNNIMSDMRRNPHMYADDAAEKFSKWSSTTASQRDKDPGIQRLGNTAWQPAVQKALGNVYRQETTKTRQKDGNFVNVTRSVYDGPTAEKRFDSYWDQNVVPGTTAADRQFHTSMKEAARSQAISEGGVEYWDNMGPTAQAEKVRSIAKERALELAKADETQRSGYAESGTVDEDNNAPGLGGDNVISQKVIYEKETNQKGAPILKWNTITIADKKASENSPHIFFDEKGVAVPAVMRSYRETLDGNKKQIVVFTYPTIPNWMTGAETKGLTPVVRYLPASEANLQVLETDFDFDPDTYIKANPLPNQEEAKAKPKSSAPAVATDVRTKYLRK